VPDRKEDDPKEKRLRDGHLHGTINPSWLEARKRRPRKA
jgi:hypothetical protein